MKRLIALLVCAVLMSNIYAAPVKDYYQLLVYHFSNAEQEKMIDSYLQTAFLPAMHKSGFKNIGVFAPITNDTATDKKIYVLVTLKNPTQIAEWNEKMLKNKVAESNASTFWNSPHTSPSYTRMESILIRAWEMAPKMTLPALKGPKEQHIYELRSYESPTDRLYWNKVHMFNEGGEVKLFARLNFNAVFYGDVLAGDRMPNLMYMTSFESMEDRETHWKEFVSSPEWKKLISMDEYKNNVSKADIILMKAKTYSDF
jgi:NIPSNAP